MSNKVFAPQYEREAGDIPIIHFPNDTGRRADIFPPDTNRHPAKANLYLIEALVDYLTAPGFTILDPMAGVGTIMVAALQGRRVICIDIEEFFHNVQLEVLDAFRMQQPDIDTRITLLHGNCKQFLPIPVQCIIFSPPYGPVFTKSQKQKGDWGGDITGELYGDTILEYCKTLGNVGKMNEFFYKEDMGKIYKLLAQCLPVNGTMAVIIKDSIKGGKRFYRSKQVIRSCKEFGTELWEWYKQPVLGAAYTKIDRSKGLPTVDDEDILILKRVI